LNFIQVNKIAQTNVLTDHIENDKAEMVFEMTLAKPARSKMIWNSKLFGKVEIMPGETKISRKEMLENPELWWPKGQGEQHLYYDEWELLKDNGAEGKLVESKTVRFGIRQTELVTEADKWGTSYVIKINGREVFCKGGDYIPQDIFPARVTDGQLQKMVQDMADANFNMVRIWGGGYYPDEAFYNACDELGLMVWQDFMFACAMYPGDPDFLENVKEEVNYQIPRIASHPCLTLFNGNNEVDVAWKNWGFQVKYLLYGQSAKEIEASYDRLFKQLLPNQVNNLSNAPYIHTSPLSNWGKDEFYNHGSQHYWGVWHGKDPMENFAKKIGRFNAEYGFQSFPEYSTLLSFSDKTQWDLNSEVMKHHQKSYVGNGMILKHAQLLYGSPANFEEFVYFSQLTQATAVSMAVTGHRLDAPRCMGTLYWQVNDCWPAPSWSSIDYFGNWKALQYWVKNDYEEVAVLGKKSDVGVQEYYLISSAPDTFSCEMKFSAFDLDGKELLKHTTSYQLNGNTKLKLSDTCLVQKLMGKNYVIRFEWNDQDGKQISRIFSNVMKPYKKAEFKDVEITMNEFDPVNKTARVLVYTKKYMRNFWLYSENKGIHFKNNFEDLLPGTHEFILNYEEMPEVNDLKFKWM
jgi:beta-mannosidase